MANLTDFEFVELFQKYGATYIAKTFGLTERGVYKRREELELKLRRQICAPGLKPTTTRVGIQHDGRIELDIPNGIILVGSDAHIWPGEPSTALRAFIKFCKEYKPKAAILNGDVLDFATISRHPPIGWEKRPTVQQEIETAQDVLYQIEKETPRGCQLVWTLGNHDSRYETRIATLAPEFAKVHGVHLRDHFPQWRPAWSCWINDDLVIKHRFKGGIHATHNNAMWSGKSMFTGHLHSLKVTPLTDYNGTRYGADGGCLADTNHRAFLDYTEDNPKNWRAGFLFATFRNGRLMWPEVVAVEDDTHVQFRGELIKV